MLNINVTCVLEVDAVGVRAVLRRRDRYVVDFDSVRIIELQMTQWAVHDAYVTDRHVFTCIKPKCLDV